MKLEIFTLLSKDTHAWAEVWLDDKGWVRIDPKSYSKRKYN